MRNLCIALLSVICLAGVSAQFNNSWTLAWQNAPIGSLCIPDSIVVAINSTTNVTSVNYTYNPSIQPVNCPSTAVTQSNLTVNVNATTNTTTVYMDSGNNTVAYTNTTPQSVWFTYNGTNTSFFFLNAQDTIPQTATFGTLGAYWNAPALLNNSNATNCSCVPDSLLVLPFESSTANLKFYSFYTSSNCSNNMSETMSMAGSTPSTINWVNGSITIAFTPSASWSNITYTYITNTTTDEFCSYSYQRNVNTSSFLSNNSWVPDWQDKVPFASNISSYPSFYQVSNVSGNYMTTTYTLNGSIQNSFLIQNTNGQYQDAYLNQAFTFDQGTNTLTTVSTDFLYSQNGSLFNASQFVQFWGTPAPVGATADCCVFTYVNITQNSANNNTLNVVYTPPEGYDNATSPCSDFHASYVNGVLESTLAIQHPSFTGLTWVDQTFGTTVAFAGNSSTIAVLFPNQCTINMTVTSPPTPPGPNPGPLSGSWISTKAMGLVMGLFVVLACM